MYKLFPPPAIEPPKKHEVHMAGEHDEIIARDVSNHTENSEHSVSQLSCKSRSNQGLSDDFISHTTSFEQTLVNEEVEELKSPVEIAGLTDQACNERLQRHDWAPIRAIPDKKFKKVVLQFVDSSDDLELEDVNVLARFEGGFHHVVILRVFDEITENDYVVKVPAIGTAARWQLGDAHNMCAEADLMTYLYEHTEIPVPEVIASEENLENNLGAPYILMRRVPGDPAYKLWFEDMSCRNHITTSRISPETEAKRINMLRSLATVMAQLQALEFDCIGMPIFTDGSRKQPPRAVHTFRWKPDALLTPEDINSDTQIYEYGPFLSTSEYMSAKLDSRWPLHSAADENFSGGYRELRAGIRKVLDIVFSHPITNTSKSPTANTDDPETFVLRHPDLDFQNILVDDNGNVTGIIDWDGCLAVPRCIGYASVPEFLRHDWLPGFDLLDTPHMGYQLEHYRQIYADAMAETGCPDARFTQKSAMYNAIGDLFNCQGNPADLVMKILLDIPSLRRTNLDQFLMFLGDDDIWPEAEEWLTKEIGKLLESSPVPP
jgi:hypothetical protein